MKLIIDINEKLVCEGFERHFTEEERNILIRAIGNSIPYEERPKGEWIPNDKISPWGNPGRSCSLCGKIVEFSENFCPKCGAKMITKE